MMETPVQVGLPAITRVPRGQAMHMNDIRHLGQSSLVTEWGRQGHSFVRCHLRHRSVRTGIME
eukprot:COSAG01_NODE_6469_length_3649_cov_2.477746_1_plen_63_part_00